MYWPILVRIAQTGLYWQAAGTALVLYDHITTFDQEVEFIWPHRWSLVKVLYILNRYIGDALMLHGTAVQLWIKGELLNKTCPSAIQVQSWLGMITLFTMNGLVIKRISCMYSSNRKVLYLLVGAYSIQIISGSVLTGLTSREGGSVVSPLTATSSYCTPSVTTPRWFWSFLFFSIIFETIVFVLALIQGIRYLRDRKPATPNHHATSMVDRLWNRQGNIVSILIRDSISFPLIGLMLALFSILAFSGRLPPPTTQIVLIINAATSPILGCRLVLNLREAYYKPFIAEFKQSQMAPDDLDIPSLEDLTFKSRQSMQFHSA